MLLTESLWFTSRSLLEFPLVKAAHYIISLLMLASDSCILKFFRVLLNQEDLLLYVYYFMIHNGSVMNITLQVGNIFALNLCIMINCTV